MPSIIRRMRTRLPTCLSVGFGVFFVIATFSPPSARATENTSMRYPPALLGTVRDDGNRDQPEKIKFPHCFLSFGRRNKSTLSRNSPKVDYLNITSSSPPTPSAPHPAADDDEEGRNDGQGCRAVACAHVNRRFDCLRQSRVQHALG